MSETRHCTPRAMITGMGVPVEGGSIRTRSGDWTWSVMAVTSMPEEEVTSRTFHCYDVETRSSMFRRLGPYSAPLDIEAAEAIAREPERREIHDAEGQRITVSAIPRPDRLRPDAIAGGVPVLPERLRIRVEDHRPVYAAYETDLPFGDLRADELLEIVAEAVGD